MHIFDKADFHAASQDRDEGIAQSELRVLRDVLKLLPAGVTVQDENGEFVLMNDAAGALLQAALRGFDGKTDIRYLKSGVHCTMQCRLPAS